mgnify:CR=1 FL=1
MNKEELHKFIEEKQPNICQVVAYKNNEKVYSDCWNNYKEDDVCLSELEDVVSLIKRKRYNSFSSMYNSIVDVMNQYKEEIDVSLLNINDDYLKSKKKDVKEFLDKNFGKEILEIVQPFLRYFSTSALSKTVALVCGL